jgi:hypothetical protein
MDPGAVATWRRVTVVDDENAAFGVPRLLIRGAGGHGPARAVTWQLRYGGLPIAAGELGPDQEPALTEVASILPSMDGAGFTITARSADGELCPVEATCVRPTRPATRAEAAARAQWPDVRNQQEAPGFRRPFLAGTRDVFAGGSPGRGSDTGGQRCVYVYRGFSVLVEYRRRRVRGDAGAAPHQAGPDRSG